MFACFPQSREKKPSIPGSGRWSFELTEKVEILNGNTIPMRRIRTELAGFFQTRANRTVHVEGDLDSSFGDVVPAADSVRIVGGPRRAFNAETRQPRRQIVSIVTGIIT